MVGIWVMEKTHDRPQVSEDLPTFDRKPAGSRLELTETGGLYKLHVYHNGVFARNCDELRAPKLKAVHIFRDNG